MTAKINGSGANVRAMTWDFDNRLTKVWDDDGILLGSYAYDYSGKRVKKIEGSTTTFVPFKHYRTVNGAATKYYYANGQRVAERTGAASTNVFYYHADHLGSANTVSDSAGSEVKAMLYFPFGATRTETGSKGIAHKYTGQEFDAGTGMYYYGARYYDVRLMRFVSADSLVQDVTDPQSFNRFAYVRNNPLKYVDPTGNYKVKTGPNGADISTLYMPAMGQVLDVIDQAVFFNSRYMEATITSGNDGVHGGNGTFAGFGYSNHYFDLAIDIRANNISVGQAYAVQDTLRSMLPSDQYYVAVEGSNSANNRHIHIEFQGTTNRTIVPLDDVFGIEQMVSSWSNFTSSIDMQLPPSNLVEMYP
ncbi:MAG: RHS repeat-associated core domain-containing protein [Pseudomonadota bacterium]